MSPCRAINRMHQELAPSLSLIELIRSRALCGGSILVRRLTRRGSFERRVFKVK